MSLKEAIFKVQKFTFRFDVEVARSVPVAVLLNLNHLSLAGKTPFHLSPSPPKLP